MMMAAAAADVNEKSIKFEMKIEQIVCAAIGIYLYIYRKMVLLLPPQAISAHALHTQTVHAVCARVLDAPYHHNIFITGFSSSSSIPILSSQCYQCCHSCVYVLCRTDVHIFTVSLLLLLYWLSPVEWAYPINVCACVFIADNTILPFCSFYRMNRSLNRFNCNCNCNWRKRNREEINVDLFACGVCVCTLYMWW